MTALIAWFAAHWSEVTATAGALWTLLSIINGAIKSPEAKTWIGKILDGLSYIKRAEAPGSVKVPFKLSKRGGASGASGKLPVALLPFLLVSSLLASGCSCFKPETRNTPGCAILHNIIDCTVDAITGGLAQSAQAIVAQYINGNASVDWDGLLASLEAAGIKDGGCILAQLENQFVGKMKAGNGDAAKTGQVSQALVRFRHDMKLGDVKFCFTPKGSSEKVCR